jgi:hypothetical protein
MGAAEILQEVNGMAITADVLAQARARLKPAFRDQALVDRFTAIRGYNVRRATADARATLTDDEMNVMRSLIARSSPLVQVTSNVVASAIGGARAEMVFRTTFKSRVPPAPPYRVIRFVRAAQINRLFRRNQESCTVPGYVCYRRLAERRGNAPDPRTLHASLMRCFTSAKWSFDGPAREFEVGRMTNVDTPGTMYSEVPYAIMADFLIALYDEAERKIFEVGRAAGWLCVWDGWPGIAPTLVRTL